MTHFRKRHTVQEVNHRREVGLCLCGPWEFQDWQGRTEVVTIHVLIIAEEMK
jgi:hypothetical protein